MRDWDEADGGAAGRVGGGPETEPERSSEPGTAAPRAPGWEPVRLLGAGAQAEVWLVEDGRGVRAALKVPRAGAAPDALAAEAQAGRVAHPHLLRVLGVVETDRGLGVLTEHRAAGTLQDMVQRVGPLSPGQAVTVLVPIAQALACLHREGVVHGDVSPANVLFGVDGSPALDGDTIIAPADVAQERGWHVGETVQVAAPGLNDSTVEATVGGIFDGSNIFTTFVVSGQVAAELTSSSTARLLMVGVNGDGSVDDETLRANLEREVRHDIVVQVRSTQDMAGEVSAMIDQMLFILYALLSLAVVIAVLGIVNTLTLSVIERRQEIGMLRAVGTQRRQVRTMITLESVQMTVYGAVLGVLLGLGLGWAFLTVLEAKGLTTIIVPWPLIGTVLAGSFVVGLLAAVWPAGRAAKTPPLDAIAE